jgi:thiamine pyrophosphate-dependent acetolactate synthase large subunit-like protein
MTPLTKMAHQIVSPATIPAIVREAFRVAQQERPGPVHLELPEDIAAEQAPEISPVPPHPIALPVAHPAELDRAAGLIRDAERPLVMLGAAASRPRLAEALSVLYQYANEMAWREDRRREPNGLHWRRVTGAAPSHPKSEIWAGYWQRASA